WSSASSPTDLRSVDVDVAVAVLGFHVAGELAVLTDELAIVAGALEAEAEALAHAVGGREAAGRALLRIRRVLVRPAAESAGGAGDGREGREIDRGGLGLHRCSPGSWCLLSRSDLAQCNGEATANQRATINEIDDVAAANLSAMSTARSCSKLSHRWSVASKT